MQTCSRLALAAIALLGYSGAEAQPVINNVTTVSWEGPYYDVNMTPCGEMDHYTVYLTHDGFAAGKAFTVGRVHEITFTNLAPGMWHFQIQAIDKKGHGSALSGGWKKIL